MKDMSELKTKPNDANVEEFIDSLNNIQRKKDAKELLDIMKKVTKTKPVMCGSSIVGFGSYHYRYESGLDGAWSRNQYNSL